MHYQSDLSFPHSYNVEYLRYRPSGDTPVYYYPSGSLLGGRDGLQLAVVPRDGPQWIGVYAFGDIGPGSITGYYSGPDPDRLYALSCGTGYVVDTLNPACCEEVRFREICHVLVVGTANLIVFGSPWAMTAFDPDGERWMSERVAVDGYTITGTSETHIYGIAHHHDEFPTEFTGEFTVDIGSGKREPSLSFERKVSVLERLRTWIHRA